MQVIRFDLTTFEDLHTYGLTNILTEQGKLSADGICALLFRVA